MVTLKKKKSINRASCYKKKWKLVNLKILHLRPFPAVFSSFYRCIPVMSRLWKGLELTSMHPFDACYLFVFLPSYAVTIVGFIYFTKELNCHCVISCFFFFMNLSFDHRLQNHFSRYLCAFSLHSRQTCAFRRLCCSYSFNSQWILPVFVWTADIYF